MRIMTRLRPLMLAALLAQIAATAAWAGPNEDFLKAAELDRPSELARAGKNGADINTRNASGETALHVALKYESKDAALWLAQQPKMDINVRNQAGETPLMLAAIRGYVDVMQALVARGAPVNAEPRQWSPLHYAASSPSVPAVQWLLDKGAQIDALSPNATTPLMMAAQYGAIDAADLLAKRGANLRARNDKNLSAADFAKMAGRDDLVKRLTPPA